MTKSQAIRYKIFTDTLFATRFFFASQYGQKFNVGEHHKKIAQALDDVFSGKTRFLMINMPPRYSKTEFMKSFVMKGLAMNPASKYILTSYSANLALDNSEHIKDAVASDWYQRIFPDVEIKPDASAKQKWYTTAGGGVYATSAQGQITGFGAGTVETDAADIESFLYGDESDEPLRGNPDKAIELLVAAQADAEQYQFGGAIIIDDPLKVVDADSPVVRQKVIDIFEGTIRSRVNSRNTPIIVVMQRLHKDDLCGYLQRPEEQYEWEVLSLPAIVTDENGDEHALYPFKHTLEELQTMRRQNKYVFETQYQQNPISVTDKTWLHAFDRTRHVGRTQYNPRMPLYLSFDFNKDPMTCSLWQFDNRRIYGIDTVRIENGTTRAICQEIGKRYPRAMLIVTGDAAGNQRSTMSQLTNYDEIRFYFRLGTAAMQVSNTNPPLAQSRLLMNNCFEKFDIIIDEERCKPLIFDCENVMSDADNKPVKTSRGNVAQQSDFLDNMRYFFHRFYKYFVPAN